MSRRRKRKKLNPSEDNDLGESKVPSPSESEPKKPSKAEEKPSIKADEEPPSPKKPETVVDLDEELEIELGDDFELNEPSSPERQSSLPSSENKRQARTVRRVDIAPEEAIESELLPEAESPAPEKKHRIVQSGEQAGAPEINSDNDELAKDDFLEKINGKVDDDLETPEAVTSDIKDPEVEPAPEETPAPSLAADTNAEDQSLRSVALGNFKALSIIEKVSLGMLALILVVAAIWSSSVVSARIPNTVIASKLKYPLEGDSVVIASYDSYWRSPIREGENEDEGVSEAIELIPEVKISLDPKSKAQSLRFLFRDEEGRYVGDSSTVDISGAKFLPADSVTATTKGNTAIVRSTTGFEHEGELISYLADETFQWEVVILESKDGIQYTEFMAIPISANRKDNS